MTPESLKHLASRLSRFDFPGCIAATRLVRRAIGDAARFGLADAEQALCQAVWSHLDAAIEDADEESLVEAELDALRAEMAGRIYTARLGLGWITRADSAPACPATLADLGL